MAQSCLNDDVVFAATKHYKHTHRVFGTPGRVALMSRACLFIKCPPRPATSESVWWARVLQMILEGVRGSGGRGEGCVINRFWGLASMVRVDRSLRVVSKRVVPIQGRRRGDGVDGHLYVWLRRIIVFLHDKFECCSSHLVGRLRRMLVPFQMNAGWLTIFTHKPPTPRSSPE